ncbi:hypothetical protein LCGC14_1497380 [marine sediment metagenome]|uniref:site-specific DNA-methyltransferase (adenine-specific) n=1 Tax=marine sediment metagenome TaxID=412755 RepID=A0A0F9J533_9ZZZZ
MWSYYGGKSKIVKKYPAPKYPIIIEPFAGTARYSLLYPNHQIILNDSYKIITDIWNYLIKATQEQIKNLPEMKKGDDVRDLDISNVEKNLMGFMVNRGVAYPHNIYTTWPAKNNEIRKTKERIIKNLEKIRHWKIYNQDYLTLGNTECTWFIDPPYQYGGDHYIENRINYEQLANWCKSRKGQIIVCENTKANWLPFRPLVTLHGQKHTTIEAIYIH